MSLKLKAEVEQLSENEFIGYIVDNEKFKGTIVQASSIKGVRDELITSIKVKMAYDYNMEIED